jgi:hypothetical protein
MTEKLTQAQKSLLKLVDRSMKGREWATVSAALWKHTKTTAEQIPDLLELDTDQHLVRPTAQGYSLLKAMKIL